jgi:hypothetical protein
MFTPIDTLPTDQQVAVLHSLDAPSDWEQTWDIGLTDPDDSYAIAPLWGRRPVDGRWPAAFPTNHSHNGDRPGEETAKSPADIGTDSISSGAPERC